MDMRLNHNLASLNVFRQFEKINSGQSDAMARMSSGLRINGAKDDPYGLAKSEKLRMQVRSLNMASQNAQDGMSMLQTVESGLEGMCNMVQRTRELIMQAGNVTYSDADKKSIQNEIDQMIDGVTAFAKGSEFNGVKLLNGQVAPGGTGYGYVETMIGGNAGETIKIPQYNFEAANIKCKLASGREMSLEDLKRSATSDVNSALQVVDNALEVINNARSKYGALENRFDETVNNINEMSVRVEGADSEIRDADVAGEMMELSKNNLLNEAGNAMMAQTNKIPQDVLRILENVRNK